MTLDDEKEALATIFFECARYERPSTEWIAALDLFTAKVTAAERERAGRVCDDEARIRADASDKHPENSPARDRCLAAARAAMNCAVGIRSGEVVRSNAGAVR